MSLSPELLELIQQHIDSVETLEILLLLQRTPETFWTASAIESHLGLKSGTAERLLSNLEQRRLLVAGMSGGYRYNPNDDAARRDVIAELATAYAGRRGEVINALYSANLTRLRAFSDAFKMRNE